MVTLYKYLPSKYLESLLVEGKFLFRSLSYFQDYEDDIARGDKYDGVLKHSRRDGIEINNLTTGESFNGHFTFESKVDAENIFVFCASTKLCAELAIEFKSDVCVEFKSPVQVIAKLHSAVSRRKRIKPNKLFHGKVKYYSEEEVPGIKWAFPDEIAMRKLDEFSSQEEYRFAFSFNDALEFEKTTQELRIGEKEKVQRFSPYPEHLLKIGSIKRWCKIHEFT